VVPTAVVVERRDCNFLIALSASHQISVRICVRQEMRVSAATGSHAASYAKFLATSARNDGAFITISALYRVRGTTRRIGRTNYRPGALTTAARSSPHRCRSWRAAESGNDRYVTESESIRVRASA